MRSRRFPCTLAVASLVAASSASADAWQPIGPWRIGEGRVAPWAEPGTKIDPAYRGGEVRFEADRVVAPHPIGCEGPRYVWLFGDEDGLFEGNLPVPRARSARRVGLGRAPFATLRVACSNAGFDFHRTEAGELLLGLDNVVWTLRATREATSPGEIVEALLIAHFTRDMAFTPESLARKRAFLTPSLQARIHAYLDAPAPTDEVPPIDGDPFTDTQEHPDRFALGAEREAVSGVVVPVHFAGEGFERRVDYRLVRVGTRWLVDDLVDERGQSLRALLGEVREVGSAKPGEGESPPRPAPAPR